MKEPTTKQMEILLTLNPFEGKTSYEKAAKELGISNTTLKKRVMRLKKRCPEVYEKFKNLQKELNQGQRAIDEATPLDPYDFEFLKMVERW